MAAVRYQPPRQSVAGQFVDVIFLLALVFVALFLPLWLKIAVPSRTDKLPEGVTVTTAAEDGTRSWSGATWENLGQNATMQQQWEKLGYEPNTAAEIITQPFDYSIDTKGLLVTGIVILGYFAFMLTWSQKEYRQVVAEKFD